MLCPFQNLLVEPSDICGRCGLLILHVAIYCFCPCPSLLVEPSDIRGRCGLLILHVAIYCFTPFGVYRTSLYTIVPSLLSCAAVTLAYLCCGSVQQIRLRTRTAGHGVLADGRAALFAEIRLRCSHGDRRFGIIRSFPCGILLVRFAQTVGVARNLYKIYQNGY